jgi:hypothetical protein
MNIVEAIKDQLSTQVVSKLSSLIGESEEKTLAAASAAVPGLLSLLAKLVSGGGADKLIDALRQVEPPSSGGFGDVLSDQAGKLQEKGGSLLNILLGSAAIPGLLSLLSKLTGINVNSAKGLLSYLAPLVLGMIAKQFSGKMITPDVLSGFFAEQKSNIASALPAGLSLADLPGSSASPTAPGPAMSAPAPAETGMPAWLLPLAALVLLGALAWYFMGQQPPAEQAGGETPVVAEKGAPSPEPARSTKVPEKVAANLGDGKQFATDLTSAYASLTEVLSGVKDSASAQSALPRLNELSPRLDGLKAAWEKLPEAARKTVSGVTSEHLAKLRELVAKVLAMPGVGEKLKPVLDGMVDKLASFTTS